MGGDAELVQKRNESFELSMIQRIMGFLLGFNVKEAQIHFIVDLDDGRHVIDTYLNTSNGKVKLSDPQELWSYGSTITIGSEKYTLTMSSLETILALRSINPEMLPDGRLIFDINPPILKYLREREWIEEKEASQRLKIYDSPLLHAAEIDFEPKSGFIIKTGYKDPTSFKFIPTNELETVAGRYCKLGDSFYPMPRIEDPEIKKWSKAVLKKIPLIDIPKFFKRDLVILRTKFNAVFSDRASSIKVIDEKVTSRVHISLGEPGKLDFKVEYQMGKQLLPHDLLVNTSKEHFQTNENTWVKIDKQKIKEVQKKLDGLGASKTEKGYQINTYRFMSLEEFIDKIGALKKLSREYRHFLSLFKGFKSNEDYRLPPHIEKDILNSGIQLRPYQRAGIHWLNWLVSHYLNGILADDMGLGKTIQTIAVMRLTYEESGSMSHSLVISPRSVIRHWHREINRVFPEISTYEYRGPNRNQNLLYSPKMRIFLSSYEMVTRDINILRKIPFLFVILDEGTKIKNPQIKRTMAVKQLNAVHRISLSGTPIENRLAELWSIFDFLMKGHLGTYGNFISRFEKPILKGDLSSSAELSKRIHPFTLRRLKEDVAKDLPEKIEMEEWCSLTEEQKTLYEQIHNLKVAPIRNALKKGKNINYTTSILPLITKLKQVCNHPALITGKMEPLLGRSEKFDLVIEKLSEFQEANEGTVLFSHFLGTLDLFEKYLNNEGINYIRIDGSTRDRQGLIDRFNNGKASVALCSIIACCYGINLTGGNHIIHVDRWWNPAIEDQATDRVHRIGQMKTVYVHKILTLGTLEEKIAALLERKKKLAEKIISTATMGEMGWSKEEMLKILEPFSYDG